MSNIIKRFITSAHINVIDKRIINYKLSPLCTVKRYILSDFRPYALGNKVMVTIGIDESVGACFGVNL